MKKAIIGLLVAGAAIAANAQDKALLETLVKKGMLTQQEAAQIAKESVAVTPATKSTKSIKIFGGAQGWYTWGKDTVKAGTATSPKQTSGFTLRYVKLGVEADVGGGWSATVVTDFGSEGSSRNYLDKVVASKKVDLDYLNGTLQLGLRKANMGYEQNMCDFGQLAIERSVATNFFTRGSYGDYSKNFGGRTVGVFWDGNITQVEGLYYSLAVTSGLTESTDGFLSSAQNSSALSFYASMGYKNIAEIKGESLAYDFGMNFGYAPQGMRNNVVNESRGSVWGINPYATASWKGLTAIAEFFLQQYEDYTPLGSGSGILSVSALRLGAASAVGVDIDPSAEHIAAANAAQNGFGPDRFTARTGDVVEDADFLQALAGDGFDIVCANIVADVIIRLAPVVPNLMRPDAAFVCSGILTTREDDVRAALAAAGLEIVHAAHEGEWCGLTARLGAR